MASSKAVPIWVSANHRQLGSSYSLHKPSGSCLNSNFNVNLGFGRNFHKWDCLGLLAQRAITPLEDEKPLIDSPPVKTEDTQITESRGFHKDLNSLPSEFLFLFFISLYFFFL